jgi:hypothetical protein
MEYNWAASGVNCLIAPYSIHIASLLIDTREDLFIDLVFTQDLLRVDHFSVSGFYPE